MPNPLAYGFDRCMWIVGIEARPQMTDLRSDAAPAAVDAAVDHQRPADAAAHGDIEHDAMTAARAKEGLGQPGGVGVVGNGGGQAECLAAPGGQGEIGPAFHLMARDRAAFVRIDRAAETDADGRRAVTLDQFAADHFDLAKDAAGPSSGRISARQNSANGEPSPAPTASCSFVPPISMPRNIGYFPSRSISR